MRLPPIVSQDEIQNFQPCQLLDVRLYFDGRSGLEAYEQAHIPGALFASLEDWAAGPASPEGGRHPFPSPAIFAAGLGSVGVDENTPVIAYDDLDGMVAGRLVWMLRILGHEAALLDGGLTNYSGELESGHISATPKLCAEREWPNDRLLSSDELEIAIASGTSTADARNVERYRGEAKGVDARAGHIPGALSLPYTGNLNEDGFFLSAKELAARFENLGESPVMHCGSGVSACHNLLALEKAGITDARLYPGSWSAWSADVSKQIETEI